MVGRGRIICQRKHVKLRERRKRHRRILYWFGQKTVYSEEGSTEKRGKVWGDIMFLRRTKSAEKGPKGGNLTPCLWREETLLYLGSFGWEGKVEVQEGGGGVGKGKLSPINPRGHYARAKLKKKREGHLFPDTPLECVSREKNKASKSSTLGNTSRLCEGKRLL